MSEHIYTIPVNEAFDACRADTHGGKPRCPFCYMREKLEQNERELILGASMMEPEIRIKTNAAGFCRRHFDAMLKQGNRLSMALILESHLAKQREAYGKTDLISTLKGKGSGEGDAAAALTASCYLCERIDFSFQKMILNAALLWEEQEDFREKIAAQSCFCLPHYGLWLKAAQNALGKKGFAGFYADVSPVMLRYFDSLSEDVSHFCKKFDYRYENEPWGNAKDAVERAAVFLAGESDIPEHNGNQ